MSQQPGKVCPACKAVRDISDVFCGICGQSFGASSTDFPTQEGADSHQPTAPGVRTPSVLPRVYTPLPSSTPTPTPPPPAYIQRTVHSRLPTKYVILLALLAATLVAGTITFGSNQRNGAVKLAGATTAKGTAQTPAFTPTPLPMASPTSAFTPTPTPKQAPAQAAVPTPIPTPTQAPPPPPPTPTQAASAGTQQVLYSEPDNDQWQAWNGAQKSPGWQVVNNTLINNGTDTAGLAAPSIVAPYQVQGGRADYAVEIRVQVGNWKVLTGTQPTASFGVSLRGTPGNPWQGYMFLQYNTDTFYSLPPGAYVENNQPQLPQANLGRFDFDPGIGNWHIYRLEVKGKTLKLFIDNASTPNISVVDTEFAQGSQIGLLCTSAQITVSNLKVIAL